MSQALSNLLALLDLEKIEEGLFRGQSEDLGLRQVFGGQVVGQALYAAKETVPVARLCIRFTATFCAPATVKNRSSTMWRCCATATALAPAGSPPSRTGSRSSI